MTSDIRKVLKMIVSACHVKDQVSCFGGIGVSPETTRHHLSVLGIRSAPQVVELFEITNGLRLANIRLLAIDEVYVTAEGNLVLHDWGTGDVDFVTVCHNGAYPVGAVVHCGRENGGDPFVIAGSIAEWLLMLTIEILVHKEVIPPGGRDGLVGVYSLDT